MLAGMAVAGSIVVAPEVPAAPIGGKHDRFSDTVWRHVIHRARRTTPDRRRPTRFLTGFAGISCRTAHPCPPHDAHRRPVNIPKMPGEPKRVQPSRARD